MHNYRTSDTQYFDSMFRIVKMHCYLISRMHSYNATSRKIEKLSCDKAFRKILISKRNLEKS